MKWLEKVKRKKKCCEKSQQVGGNDYAIMITALDIPNSIVYGFLYYNITLLINFN